MKPRHRLTKIEPTQRLFGTDGTGELLDKQRGVYEGINDALWVQVREASGRNTVPSAGIVDSRSVKTSQKGGLVGTMAARKSTDANTTSS